MGSSEARCKCENNLIGSLIFHSSVFKTLDLVEEDFFSKANLEVFRAMKKLSAENRDWDLSILLNHVDQYYWGHLNSITDDGNYAMFLPSLIPDYVNELRELKAKAVVEEVICEIGTGDPLAFAQAVQERTARLQTKTFAFSLREILPGVMNRLEKAADDPDKLSGIPTGFKPLDEITWGLQPQRLYLLAARPSMGKSALSLNIATNAAKQGHRVYLQSLEESGYSVASRLLSRVTRIPNESINRGKINGDWDRIASGMQSISELPLILDESAGISSEEICRRVRKEHARGPLSLLVVDHLQQIRENEQNRHLELSKAATNLKELSKELKIPVLAVCQLNRGVELRADKRPLMSDLKESGDLEAIADMVLLLYRPAYYDHDAIEKDKVEISIAKNRDGRVGPIELRWNPEFMTFYG